jgi:hypothetical protein
MKRFRGIPLTVCCLLLAAALPASAARKLRAIFIQPGPGAPEKALLHDGKSSFEVELPQRNFSPEVDMPEGDLELACLTGSPAAGEALPAGAPRVKIPKEWKRGLLLFFPDPANRLFPARIVAVNASQADFKMGQSLVFNVSKATIRGKFGNEVITVAPGGKAIIKPPVDKQGDYLVAIDSAMPGDKEATPICRTTWRHEPEARQILFVTPEPGRDIPRVWGILDREE